MDVQELRIRILEAALAREETAGAAFLYADLYLAWVNADESRFAMMVEAIRQASPSAPSPMPSTAPPEESITASEIETPPTMIVASPGRVSRVA